MADMDKKKYNKMENVLQYINKSFVTLNDEEKKKVYPILSFVIEDIIKKMKNVNPLFSNLFESVFYGGSYYDGLKVGKPEEFDIDLKMNLPKLLETKLIISNEPGFVKIHMQNWEKLEKSNEFVKFSELAKYKDKDNYLLQNLILSWMESTVDKALKKYQFVNNAYQVPYPDKDCMIEVRMRKGGPAMTLLITCLDIVMDVDLVASFKFTEDNWPTSPFKKLPSECSKKEFLVVPKRPKQEPNDRPERLWRLSFQEQERELMNGNDRLKPALRLMKKFRDTNNQSKISSYFLKTIFLSEYTIRKNDSDFWRSPLSFVFMHMLKLYYEHIEKQNIPYFWNPKNNLLKGIEPKTLENYKYTLKKIIDIIDKKFENEPSIIAEYISTSEELTILQETSSLFKVNDVSTDLGLNLLGGPQISIPNTSNNSVKQVISQNNDDEIINMFKLIQKQIQSIQNDNKTILKRIVNIETSVSDIKQEHNSLRCDLQSYKTQNVVDKSTEINLIISEYDTVDSTENVQVENKYNGVELVGSTTTNLISSATNVDSSCIGSLLDKMLLLEKQVNSIKNENLLLKTSLRNYVLDLDK